MHPPLWVHATTAGRGRRRATPRWLDSDEQTSVNPGEVQESKVIGCRSGLTSRLKVVCRGPDIWVFHDDMQTPVIREYETGFERAGWVGLWTDHVGKGLHDNISVGRAAARPAPPLRTDWSWVRGAVCVRSSAVNSVQMWHDYWDHTDVLDRELSYASSYGFNMIPPFTGSRRGISTKPWPATESGSLPISCFA